MAFSGRWVPREISQIGTSRPIKRDYIRKHPPSRITQTSAHKKHTNSRPQESRVGLRCMKLMQNLKLPRSMWRVAGHTPAVISPNFRKQFPRQLSVWNLSGESCYRHFPPGTCRGNFFTDRFRLELVGGKFFPDRFRLELVGEKVSPTSFRLETAGKNVSPTDSVWKVVGETVF